MSSRSLGLGDICRGAAAGAIGGFAASWVMNQFMMAAQRRAEQTGEPDERHQARQPDSSASSPQQQKEKRQRQQDGSSSSGSGEDATVKTAQVISRNLFDHELSQEEKEVAGPAVHYAYGALIGSLYGAVAEVWPTIATGFGMPYGVAVWALGDEIAVPALRLGPPPTQVPAEKHADFLAAHIVYGIALDVSRRVARHVV
jgi:putative membrane protein